MTKINGAISSEVKLLENAKKYAVTLLSGTNKLKFNYYYDKLSDYLEDISIFSYDDKNSGLDNNIPGVCCCDYKDGTSNIKMCTIYPANQDDKLYLMHLFIHEICHALCNMLNHEYRPKVSIRTLKNGRRYYVRNNSGCVSYTDTLTNERFEYGTMFTETFTDMFTTMALIAFNDYYPKNFVCVDDVLKNHVNDWYGVKTGYSMFTSLTRLMCAAFNNIPDVSYDEVLEKGLSMFKLDSYTDTSKRVKVNDFMYGMLYDPMYIESKFDSLMGSEAYINMCYGLDNIFEDYSKTGVITRKMAKEIKNFMATLTKFVYLKCDYNVKLSIWTSKEAKLFLNNYSEIFITLEDEYRSYFSNRDISKLSNSTIPLMIFLKSSDADIFQKINAIKSTIFTRK